MDEQLRTKGGGRTESLGEVGEEVAHIRLDRPELDALLRKVRPVQVPLRIQSIISFFKNVHIKISPESTVSSSALKLDDENKAARTTVESKRGAATW